MKNLLSLFFTLLFLTACTTSQKLSTNPIKPMTNGEIKQLEWADASKIDIQNKFQLYLKEDDYYYYIAIENKTEFPFYVDLFFFIDNSVYNIHSSSQLGERKLEGTDWDDRNPVTHWGYLRDWTSNPVLFDRLKLKKLRDEGFEGNTYKETVLPYDGFEFQFSKSTWNLNQSKMRVEMRDMVGIEDYQETVFPINSERMKNDNWHVLKF